MIDPRTGRALAALRDEWGRQGILNERTATEQEIAAFEQRYGVVMPADLRAYFLLVNGTVRGSYGPDDEYSHGFWHLDEIQSVKEVYGKEHVEDDRCFVFMDNLFNSWHLTVRLSLDPTAPTPIIFPSRPHIIVANSFTEYIELYLAGGREAEDPSMTPEQWEAWKSTPWPVTYERQSPATEWSYAHATTPVARPYATLVLWLTACMGVVMVTATVTIVYILIISMLYLR